MKNMASLMKIGVDFNEAPGCLLSLVYWSAQRILLIFSGMMSGSDTP